MPANTNLVITVTTDVPLADAGKMNVNAALVFSGDLLGPITADPDFSYTDCVLQQDFPAGCGNNLDGAVTQTASADINLTKTLDLANANVGGVVVATITATNAGGASDASMVVISDTVDANQSIVSATIGAGTCEETGNANADISPAYPALGNTATCTLGTSSPTEVDIASPGNAVLTVTHEIFDSQNNVCEDDAEVQWADPKFDNASASLSCFPPNVRMVKDAENIGDPNAAVPGAGNVNLFLCVDPDVDGPGPDNPSCEYYDQANGAVANNGRGHLVVHERLFNQNDTDGAGAFEFQLKFDHKIFDISVRHGNDLNDDGDCSDNGEDQAQDEADAADSCYLYQTGRIPQDPNGPDVGGCLMTIVTENYILFGCVSKDNPAEFGPECTNAADDDGDGFTNDGCPEVGGASEQGADCEDSGEDNDANGFDGVVNDGCPAVVDPDPEVGPQGPADIVATIHIDPEPDLINRLHPGQKNGIVRTILDENCEVADIFGDPLGTGSYDDLGREILLPGIVTGGLIEACEDLTVTLRILEGDLNVDCIVDATDDQMEAFRYGAFFGSLYYDPWFDLEPALKDFDVDIKDLQKVFGRNGSTCDDPIPDQDAQPGPPAGPNPGPLP
jgi:uncharacterized repeat protein (TIGR01451 family)